MRIAAHTLILQRQCAADWAELSKIKPSDMPRWWRAGAFEPEAAQSLIELGVGAGLAKLPCKEGCEKFETFAYQVSMGMLSAEQAKREIRAD